MDLTGTKESPLREEEAARLRELLAELGEQASLRRFRVAPNPCVGAAILSDGVEIGRGFHEVWGQAHAERNAIEAARASGVPQDRWDTLVVTLEPCSSVGKTSSCVEAILATGFRRVVVGALDPDVRHQGNGLELLRNAGLDVIHLEHASPLAKVSPYFERWTRPERLRRQRPWLIAKWAQTRTGQLSPPSDVGDGRWISGPESLARVHVLRSRVDAIVTGIGTVIADDPRFTVRGLDFEGDPPLRAVLDTTLRMRNEWHIFDAPREGERGGPVHIFTRPGVDGARRREIEATGATLHLVPTDDNGRPSLREVSSALWELGVRRALLEAGPRLLKAWFEAEFVDQIQVYTGNVNGGRGESMADALRPDKLESVLHHEIGDDSLLEAFLIR